MGSTDMRFLFARLNIVSIGLFAVNMEKLEKLSIGLTAKHTFDLHGNSWGFFNVSQLQLDDQDYLYGNLVKFAPIGSRRSAQLETQTTETVEMQNDVIAESPFYLQIGSGLIAYHPVANHIGTSIFRSRFIDVFHLNTVNYHVHIELSNIDIQNRLLTEIDTFTKLTSIGLSLVPSNPSNRDVWAKVDDRLKLLAVARHHEKYDVKSGTDGASLKDDIEIRAKITMAEDGYGDATAKGIKNGRKITVSTKQQPVSTVVLADQDSPEKTLVALKSAIKDITDRFR